MTTSHLLRRCLLARRQRAAISTAVSSRNLGIASSYRPQSGPLHQIDQLGTLFHGSSKRFRETKDLRCLSTKSTGDNSLDEDEWKTTEDYTEMHRHSPQNDHQRKLIDYTNSLLSTDDKDYPIGAYPLTDLIQMSNCIDSWIASGEHRHLGAQQAIRLVKRLIIERGGGKSLMEENTYEANDGNPDVTWDMYHMESLILWLNSLYYGREFNEIISSIMSLFEAEYGNVVEVKYKIIISILCKCDTGHAATAAERILHHYELKALERSSHFDLPTTETYNNLITSWVNSDQSFYPHGYTPGFQHSAHPPANILSEMISMYKRNPSELYRIRPDRVSFNMTLSSLSRHKKREQSMAPRTYLKEVNQLAFYFLKSMIEHYKDGHEDCAPDMVCFSTVLNMLQAGPADKDDGYRASEILDEMIAFSSFDDFEHHVTPSTLLFNVVLGLMAEQRQVDNTTLDRAKTYVAKMYEIANSDEDSSNLDHYLNDFDGEFEQSREKLSSKTSTRPDTVTYNCVLKIAANAGLTQEAEDILYEMIDKANAGDNSASPDLSSFNTVLNALSKSKDPHIGEKSTQIMQTMNELSKQGSFPVRPDNVTLTTVINSLIKTSQHSREAPIQAEAIIQKMNENADYSFRPDTITYTSLIKCWSESGRPKAAQRAEEIIELLHRRYEEGHKECQPDSMAYNVALNAIAKSGVQNCAQRAEAMLLRMKERYDAGNVDLAPTTHSISTVINAWSKSGHVKAGIHAENLLETMVKLHEQGLHDVAPNTVTYSSCINAWSRSKHPDAGRRATAMLQRMDALDDESYINIKPNVYSFTSAIDAWVNSGDPDLLDEASAIFDTMMSRYKAGEEESKPTPQTFNAMFRAVTQSPLKKKYLKAEELMNQMKQIDGIKPNIATYNTYLNACACTEGDRAAKLAAITCVFNTLTELQETNLQSDSYTWPAIWKCCIKLLDIKQDIQRINMVFELCARSGAMSQLVFNNIRNFLPPQYLKKKLNTDKDVFSMTIRDLPPEWTCNVKMRRNKNRGDNEEKT